LLFSGRQPFNPQRTLEKANQTARSRLWNAPAEKSSDTLAVVIDDGKNRP
jgi:hypothetical protein